MKIYSSVSSENFRISASIFRSLVHFEIVFVYSVGSEFNFIHCQVKIQLIKNHILKKLFFFTVWSWAPFENKMVLYIYIDRYKDIKFYFISLSILIVVSLCFDYISFFEIRRYESSNFVLIFQNCLFEIPYELKTALFISEKLLQGFHWICRSS